MKKLISKWYSSEFIFARIVIYTVLFLYGIYIVFFDKTFYLCNLEGNSCPLCGMKTAIHHVLKFQFVQAHQSNPLIWLMLLVVLLILVDVISSICVLKKRKS